MTDKTITFAVIFVIMYGIGMTIFVLRVLYQAKVHVKTLYGKTAVLHNELRETKVIARDAQSFSIETQNQLNLVNSRTTRNFI